MSSYRPGRSFINEKVDLLERAIVQLGALVVFLGTIAFVVAVILHELS
ncbi:hypothetical protein HRbin25_00912 [bacterium HR25]|jgi:hypothetical protein|nr:hypothetical protein HRbin25_00912 [bacterium HR25]